ncbi:hypothetical protein J4212_02065 [Candidatus Woesearchaeota archaeon]|nr:hypothetical protein [Candidatus Woesearchaeota archaeon]
MRIFGFAVLALIFIALAVPLAYAQQGHMKLLAVSETEQGLQGGIADLFLEVKPGTGRVFLETFPLTKLDTQISTRFAKQIACDFADVDCSRYDFFYTITADSPIIAGPSAGSAIAVLTFSIITGEKIDSKTAITGTINSGGLIGPVGGIKAKIEAAEKIGMKKVLIPLGELNGFNDSSNESLDLDVIRQKSKIEIIEAATLDEALLEFTGRRFREQTENLTINENYKDTMRQLAVELCSRSTKLSGRVSKEANSSNITRIRLEQALNLTRQGKDAFEKGHYYSSASFCFGSNVEYSYLALNELNMSEAEIKEKINTVLLDINSLEKSAEKRKIKTITDLEAYMVVKERLSEARDLAKAAEDGMENRDAGVHNLAFAIERFNSAKSWEQFFKGEGKEFNLDKEKIKDACRVKISEVEERIEYVRLTFPNSISNTKKELDAAYSDLNNGNYELCLFRASKAKANIDSVLSVFGVELEGVDEVIGRKLKVAERNFVEETDKGVFPILGYSYLEYANSLRENDPFSALLYSSYALELGDLDIYFEDKADGRLLHEDIISKINVSMTMVFSFGIVLGIIISNIASKRNKKIPKKKK